MRHFIMRGFQERPRPMFTSPTTTASAGRPIASLAKDDTATAAVNAAY
jgi:hypothetical protein